MSDRNVVSSNRRNKPMRKSRCGQRACHAAIGGLYRALLFDWNQSTCRPGCTQTLESEFYRPLIGRSKTVRGNNEKIQRIENLLFPVPPRGPSYHLLSISRDTCNRRQLYTITDPRISGGIADVTVQSYAGCSIPGELVFC